MMEEIGLQPGVFSSGIPSSRISMQFDQEEQHYDHVKAGSDISFHFPFSNSGEDTLAIRKAEHPCDCIELDWTRGSIVSHDTGSIRGVFHARQKGPFNKEIYIHISSPEASMKTVRLKGVIE
jgi:hypothetical protein